MGLIEEILLLEDSFEKETFDAAPRERTHTAILVTFDPTLQSHTNRV